MERKITRREVTKTVAKVVSAAGLLAFVPSCSSVLSPADVRDLLRSDLSDFGGDWSSMMLRGRQLPMTLGTLSVGRQRLC